MLVGSPGHTTNYGSTSAEWKHGWGGLVTTTRLPLSTGLTRPKRLPPGGETPPWMPGVAPDPEEIRPQPRGAASGVKACLRGRARTLLGEGEPGPSWRAFPFSAAENLFISAMDVAAGPEATKKEEAEREEMGDGGSVPPSQL